MNSPGESPARQVSDDYLKEKALRNTRNLATSLLLLMVSVVIIARTFEKSLPWLGFFRAFAEAAMVGALADWFAVSALFRRPLGLKLPHTAIIPRNKDRIGEGLGKFVQENFLTPEAIADRVKTVDIAGRTAEWLSNPANRKQVADEVRAFLPKVLDLLDDEEVRDFVRSNAVQAAKSEDLVSLAGDFLDILTSRNRHQELFDDMLELIRELFEEYKPDLRSRITRESGIFLTILGGDIALYNKLTTVVTRTLDEVASDPDHELRKRYNEAMQDFILNLKTSPEYGSKIEEIREDVFSSPTVTRYFENVWSDIKNAVLAGLAEPGSLIRERTKEVIRKISTGTLADTHIRRRLNSWIRNVLTDTLARHRDEIGNLIADRVKQWDAATLADKLELEVGRDLQFIRINGTVIGGLIGLLLHLVYHFL